MVRLAGVVAVLSCLPAGLLFALRRTLPLPAKVILGQWAAVGFITAIAATDVFAERSTFILGKNHAGHISWWGYAAFWPYHLGLRTKLWVQALYSSEDPYNEVAPGWYLGWWPAEIRNLPPGNPAIVDVTCELPILHPELPFLNLMVWDTSAPTVDQIERGVKWALEQHNKRPVLFHCAHGHGRSNVLMCATLIELGKASTAQEALAIVKQARPRVKLNKPQLAAVEKWIQMRESCRKAQ